MKKLRLYVLAVLMATSNVLFLVPAEQAAAVSGECYFRTTAGPVTGTGTCSVPGYGSYGTHDVLTGRSSSGSGYAIPLSVNSKGEFINYLLNRFNGNTHNKVGAAFIMQEMRGDRTWPSNADVNDWVERMRDPDVTVRSQWDGNIGRTSWYDPGKRNTFYGPHPSVGRQVINIYYKGNLRAQIEHACGNMVAGVISLPKPFDFRANTRVDRETASPGHTITWTHTIWNAGPGPTTNPGHYTVDTGSTPVRTRSGNFSDDIASGRDVGWSKTITQRYVVRDGDLGERFCQRLNFRPADSTNNGTESTEFKCVRIVRDFELTPSLTGQTGNVPAGDSVDDVDAYVAKTGRDSDAAQWVFGKLVAPPGVGIPGSGGVTQSTDGSPARYRDPAVGRTWVRLDDGQRSFSNSNTRVATDPTPTIGSGLEVGTRVCWTLAVKPPNSFYDGWRYAKPICITVMPQPLKPTTQLWGFDGRFGGKVVTSTARISNRTYGSWSEYGVLSGGQNIGFGSGAGLESGSTSANQSSWSKLTFANAAQTGCGGSYGCHGFVGYPDDMVQALQSRCESNGGTIGGRTVSTSQVLCVNGTARITGDINYGSGNTSNISRLPQLVIIANDIIIDKDVQNVDAWLLAIPETDPITGVETGGRISTCSAVRDAAGGYFPAFGEINGGLQQSTCPNRLTVTGPVVASSLYLYRTTDPNDQGRPAEVFNLRADAFLWAYAGGLADVSSVAQTTSLREIPPRF